MDMTLPLACATKVGSTEVLDRDVRGAGVAGAMSMRGLGNASGARPGALAANGYPASAQALDRRTQTGLRLRDKAASRCKRHRDKVR
jgi:hypothetical protein